MFGNLHEILSKIYILQKSLLMKNKEQQHQAAYANSNKTEIHFGYSGNLCQHITTHGRHFLNIPLDLWRSQWSSGRRRTLTEEWVLLCFQSTGQLEQGACALQHLWSLSAPRAKKRNTSIMGVTTCFNIPLRTHSLSLLI